MSEKSTNGPWDIAGNYAVVWHKDVVVATCPVDGGAPDDVRHANARLIALAPELKKIVERVSYLHLMTPEAKVDIEDASRALLAKLEETDSE
jgi:hypothetical protein